MALAPVAVHPKPPLCPAGGASGPSVSRGAAGGGGGGGGSSPPCGGGGPSFQHSRGPAQIRGEVDLKHTCDCPWCMVHYETCLQSLMAELRDLQTQNQELQQSHQELSQAVSAAAGISQSYGDPMTQLLSTLTKHDEVVRGYRRESKAVAASVADHLKMSNSNTAKCFGVVETLAKHYATVASRIDARQQWYATPTEPVMGVPPPSSTARPVSESEPAAPRPFHPVVVVCFLSRTTHPAIASII